MANMLMVDLETLATTPDAVVASIGMVAFDPYEQNLTAEFYGTLSLAGQERRRIDPNTLNWWLGQSPAAIGTTFPKQPSMRSLETLCKNVTSFYQINRCVEVWSHGATFDVPILEHIYKQLGLKVPWGFRDVRCSRTVCELARVEVERKGVAHNAGSDALFQARYVMGVFKQLGLANESEMPD